MPSTTCGALASMVVVDLSAPRSTRLPVLRLYPAVWWMT
jgi:hypothetical protein